MGADGGPETDAYVHLLAAGVQGWFSELSAVTDNKRQFSITGVPSGSYYISAGTYERGKTHNTRMKIEVGESNVDSIVLSLSGESTIHSRVVGGNSRTSGGTPRLCSSPLRSGGRTGLYGS